MWYNLIFERACIKLHWAILTVLTREESERACGISFFFQYNFTCGSQRFNFIIHCIRVSMHSMGFLRTMSTMMMGNLGKVIVKVKMKSCSVVSDSLRPHGLYTAWNSPGQNTGVGIQGIFPTQGSNQGLSNCRWILYQLNHKGSPRILERVAYPFFSGSSWSRNQTGVSCIAAQTLYQLSYQGNPTITLRHVYFSLFDI